MAERRESPLIFIADDDAMARLLMREVLEKSGISVEEAADGYEMMALVSARNPDMVILDVKMPKMDGFEACAAIRKLPGGEDLPILMATGLDDVASINRAFNSGATSFITKPINWSAMDYHVRYMLRANDFLTDLKKSEERNRRLVENLSVLVYRADPETREAIFVNDNVEKIFAFTSEEWLNTPAIWEEAIHPVDREEVMRQIGEARKEHHDLTIEYRIVRKDGSVRFVEDIFSWEKDGDGNVIYVDGIISDISARKEAESKALHLAYYDSLTDLPNRQLFMDRMKTALWRADRLKHMVALVYLDLDNFKDVNDSLSHAFGDALLGEVAKRLTGRLRRDMTLSRLGGDEFTLIIDDITDLNNDNVVEICEKIFKLLSEPFYINGTELFISASMGISVFPEDGKDVPTLLKNADTAMYYAKNHGKSSYQFFSRHMNEDLSRKLSTENSLRHAIERGEFLLYYQPQIETQTDRVIGQEALIRWRHPTKGLVMPSEFIPVAEGKNLIIDIDRWVVHEAYKQARAWNDAGIGPLRMAINFSSLHCRRGKIIDTIEEVLREVEVDPQLIDIEITESALMEDIDKASKTLKKLKDMGFNISLDDFGTGYSSLYYLKRLPIDKVKIDRSFIHDISKDDDAAAIVRAIINLAHNLGMKVLAEGVETSEQLDFLKSQGCDEVQGFLICKPMPVKDYNKFIKKSDGMINEVLNKLKDLF